MEAASLFDAGGGGGGGGGAAGGLDPAFTDSGDGHDNERVLVAHWLRMYADRVRVLQVEGPDGLSMRADRIPKLAELCGGTGLAGSSEMGGDQHWHTAGAWTAPGGRIDRLPATDSGYRRSAATMDHPLGSG